MTNVTEPPDAATTAQARLMKFDAGNNRTVELHLSPHGTHQKSPIRRLQPSTSGPAARGPFYRLRQVFSVGSCMTARAVANTSPNVSTVDDDSSVYSVGGLVECMAHSHQQENIESASIDSSRVSKVKRTLLPNIEDYHGEFFDISDLQEDVCKFLSVKPAICMLFDIPDNSGKVRFEDVSNEFLAAKFATDKLVPEKPGVPASEIFSTLRAFENRGDEGMKPSHSLKRYMLCQLLSTQNINSSFEEQCYVDSLEGLYENGGEIEAELYGFIANDDAKQSMQEYFEEQSVPAQLEEHDFTLSPAYIVKRLGLRLLSTQGTGELIANALDPARRIKARLKQDLTESDNRVNEIVKLILHGPGGGDAQAVLMAIGSPIPEKKMLIGAALVFDVMNRFPNPDLEESKKLLVNRSSQRLSDSMATFRRTGRLVCTEQNSENARAFLLGHGLINDHNEVVGPKGPVTGHYDSVFFSNSKEGSLEHMFKKAMLVNAIMALGKENIINKASANDLLNAVFTNEMNAYYQTLVDVPD